jgi:phosphoglycerate kinase
MSALPTIADLDVTGRTVLVRSDLNVPIDQGTVVDDFRITAAVPTIDLLRRLGARVVVASHLGRPDGFDRRFSMAPVARVLAERGGFPVTLADDVAGDSARSIVTAGDDSVVLLENTRFEPGEVANDPDLSDRLAALADVFVMDAFGSAHRAHSSTVGVAERLPSAAGPLLLAEVEAFDALLSSPEPPFVVVLGGAKVSSKIGVIESLIDGIDLMLIGGAMCFTLLAARGLAMGRSPVETTMVDAMRDLLAAHGDKIVLPVDLVVGDEFSMTTPHRVCAVGEVPDEGVALDIGPATAADFAERLGAAGTVFWNGPLGVAEWPEFAAGTRAVAEAIGRSAAFSVAGGGDSVAVLREMGLTNAVSHLSTGGGAGLELIESGTLPGIEVLRR